MTRWIVDVDQIANDAMKDLIDSVARTDPISPRELTGLCRVITLRRVVEAVRRANREKRIGSSQLVSPILDQPVSRGRNYL